MDEMHLKIWNSFAYWIDVPSMRETSSSSMAGRHALCGTRCRHWVHVEVTDDTGGRPLGPRQGAGRHHRAAEEIPRSVGVGMWRRPAVV